MKNILKLSVAFLIIFAMVGMASAYDEPISLDSIEVNGTNYDIVFDWTGTPGEILDVDLDGTSVSWDESVSGKIIVEDVSLTDGQVYEVNVTYDDSIPSVQSATFTFLDAAFNLISLDSSDVSDASSGSYDIDWDDSLGYDIQIYEGSWTTYSTSPASVSVAASINSLIYRASSGTDIGANTTITFDTIPAASISNTSGTDFVEWTVSGVDFTDSDVFYVLNNSSGTNIAATDISGAAGSVNVTGLTAGMTYTLFVRANDTTTGYGPYVSDPVTIATPLANALIDWSNTDEVDAANTTGNDLSFEVSQQLNLTAETLENCSFDWSLECTDNSSVMETQTTVTDDTIDEFNYTFTAMGNYTLTLIVTEVADSTNQETVTWDITVTERSTGKRIWTDGMPTTYTWDSRSFSGFYYNLDNGEGNESMTITNIGRTLARGSINYTTTPSYTNYSYSSWGSYSIVGFMGDKYYAGDLMSGGNLSKVLIDENNRTMLRVGQYYALEEGYSLKANQIDLNGNIVQFILEKDGREIDSGFARSGENYVYEKKINNRDIEFVKVHVDTVFQGSESSLVQISGVFQISDQLTPLKNGEKIGKMEITNPGSGGFIEMKNSESISLSQNTTVNLMGKMNFIVADNSTLKFAPTIEYTDPGIYEIRGTVSDFSVNNSGVFPYNVTGWDPNNFEGFYFDINDDAGAMEKITIDETPSYLNDTKRIRKGNLTYSAEVTNVTFSYSSWKEYQVIGFMGEKYYAGTTGKSLLSNGNLSKVLMDDNERRQLRVGQYLTLEDGYSLKADQINVQGSSVLFVLEKDGKVVSTYPASSTSPFVYEKKVGNLNDVEFIKVNVREVFQGTESSIVMIDGVFQISDNLTRLENNAKYGNMTVNKFDKDGIELKNDVDISLSYGNTVDFMTVGNSSMSFKVGDNSSVLRFAPIVTREIGSDTALEVELSSAAVTAGDPVTITVKDRGVTIEGVTVTANGTNVGTTNASGVVSYTPNSVGTIRITAEKSGYVGGNATLTVNEKLLNMTITVTPEPLYQGTEGVIKVTNALNGTALSGATVTIGVTPVGQTNANGEVRYNFTQPGAATVQSSMTGYINATKSVNVLQKVAFTYSNFSLNKENVSAKSNVKLSFDITNTGIENGSHNLTLVVTDSEGTVVNETTKSISVDVGKSKSASFSFKVPLEGSYSVALREDGARQIDLPQNISTISAGPSKLLGSNLLYIVIGIFGLAVLAVIGVVAYLFGIKGANTSNFSEVGGEVWSDIKSKLHLSKKMK